MKYGPLTHLLLSARALADDGIILYRIDQALFLVRREYHRHNLRVTKEQ